MKVNSIPGVRGTGKRMVNAFSVVLNEMIDESGVNEVAIGSYKSNEKILLDLCDVIRQAGLSASVVPHQLPDGRYAGVDIVVRRVGN